MANWGGFVTGKMKIVHGSPAQYSLILENNEISINHLLGKNIRLEHNKPKQDQSRQPQYLGQRKGGLDGFTSLDTFCIDKGQFYGMGYRDTALTADYTELKEGITPGTGNEYMLQLVLQHASKHPQKVIREPSYEALEIPQIGRAHV